MKNMTEKVLRSIVLGLLVITYKISKCKLQITSS